MTLFSKLRELEKKATPGPWRSDSDGDVWTEAEKEYCPGMDQELFRNLGTTRCGPDRGDAALTAEMRNTLPKIFEVLDLYEEALTQVGCEYCDKFGEQVDRTMTQARELAGE